MVKTKSKVFTLILTLLFQSLALANPVPKKNLISLLNTVTNKDLSQLPSTIQTKQDLSLILQHIDDEALKSLLTNKLEQISDDINLNLDIKWKNQSIFVDKIEYNLRTQIITNHLSNEKAFLFPEVLTAKENYEIIKKIALSDQVRTSQSFILNLIAPALNARELEGVIIAAIGTSIVVAVAALSAPTWLIPVAAVIYASGHIYGQSSRFSRPRCERHFDHFSRTLRSLKKQCQSDYDIFISSNQNFESFTSFDLYNDIFNESSLEQIMIEQESQSCKENLLEEYGIFRIRGRSPCISQNQANQTCRESAELISCLERLAQQSRLPINNIERSQTRFPINQGDNKSQDLNAAER